jgi:hypothetical protein
MKKFKSEPDVMDEIGCREMSLRMISAVVLICVALTLPGCASAPNFAPLISQPTIKLIQIDNSPIANGNTVPVSAVP